MTSSTNDLLTVSRCVRIIQQEPSPSSKTKRPYAVVYQQYGVLEQLPECWRHIIKACSAADTRILDLKHQFIH